MLSLCKFRRYGTLLQAKYDPDLVVLLFGTNNLRNEESLKKIASDIASVAGMMRSNHHSIICRGDALHDKADLVKRNLYALC